ncbi:MAG: hypothetical protein R2795_17395 [Saprospiraceae bacterium]
MIKRFFFLAAIAILTWTTCDTDFQIEGEWKDIPVVYAFFSEQDDAWYVRLEKAFLQPGGNATQIAQIPDSIYYAENQATVTLQNLRTGQSVNLQRIDGRDDGIFREEGDFAQAPNILYKAARTQLNLAGGDAFQITVTRGGETTPAIAQSVMLEMIEITGLPQSGQMTFGDYTRQARVGWRYFGDAARVLDVRMYFRYLETDPANPSQLLNKEIVWELAKAVNREDGVSSQNFILSPAGFYSFLGENLQPLTTGIRRFDNLVFQVTAGGEEIEQYLQIANANIGITSSQSVPVFTNVENGYGIVSSRYTTFSNNLNLDPRSRDSLYNGSLTKNLGFVP